MITANAPQQTLMVFSLFILRSAVITLPCKTTTENKPSLALLFSLTDGDSCTKRSSVFCAQHLCSKLDVHVKLVLSARESNFLQSFKTMEGYQVNPGQMGWRDFLMRRKHK